MKRKQRDLECQLNLQFNKPFSTEDLPKNPQTASEKVLVFCINLFQTTKPTNRTQRQMVIHDNLRVLIKPVSRFSRMDLLPRGEGARDCFERDLNCLENYLDDELYMW